MVRFEFNRASQIQGQIQNLDSEKSNLVNELAALPTAAATPAAPAPQPPSPETSRIRCQDMPAAVDNALKTRRREARRAGGAEGHDPLATITGQTPYQISPQDLRWSSLARPPRPGWGCSTPMERKDRRFVDVPLRLYRLVRQRAEGP